MELSATTLLFLWSTSTRAFTGPALATLRRGISGSSSITRIASTASTASSSGAASVGEVVRTVPRGPPIPRGGIRIPSSESFTVGADENFAGVVAMAVVVQGRN